MILYVRLQAAFLANRENENANNAADNTARTPLDNAANNTAKMPLDNAANIPLDNAANNAATKCRY